MGPRSEDLLLFLDLQLLAWPRVVVVVIVTDVGQRL